MSVSVSRETAAKIQDFAEKCQRAEEEYTREPLDSSALQSYSQQLDETVRELQSRVKHQEDELEKVRYYESVHTDKAPNIIQLRKSNSIDLSKIDRNTWARVSEVRRAKKAYDLLLQSDSDIPEPGSPLPSLLAVEETCRLLKETKVSVSKSAEQLSTNRQRLKTEETNLQDARLIRAKLEERIERARSENSKKKEKSPAQLAREHIKQQQKKNAELGMATDELRDSLHKFIDDTLAPMLAAEDLGGPTVGETIHISDAVLEAGYTSHGKPKKPKSVDPDAGNDGQQHIDDLFRRRQPDQGDEQRNRNNKRQAAAEQMHTLLVSLMEAGSSYIDVSRESAASRFLVRAKVAQFHPRDARRLRLIDFGRSLGD